MSLMVLQILIMFFNSLLGLFELCKVLGGIVLLRSHHREIQIELGGNTSASLIIYFLFNVCFFAATIFGSVAAFLKNPVMLIVYTCVLSVIVFFQLIGLLLWSASYNARGAGAVGIMVVFIVIEVICTGLCSFLLYLIHNNDVKTPPVTTQ